MQQAFHYQQPFPLESGASLPELHISYHTYGQLSAAKDNVIWICHALTASADAADWWNGLVDAGKTFDTNQYFIICANILGSCYGTTGPTSIAPASQQAYGIAFPCITIRDMVAAHRLLQKHIGIDKIHLLAGGSMGGYQALEWATIAPNDIGHLMLIATAAAESAWGKAIHATQRMAIEADPAWQAGIVGKGDAGLKAARGIGMLTYRNYNIFNKQQTDIDNNEVSNHKAAQYIAYQAQKLANRFDALTYHKLTTAMDTHQLARHRKAGIESILHNLLMPTLVMGISSDILCPPAEQQFIAAHMPNALYVEIDSDYGHDGFLIENEKIGKAFMQWMQDCNTSKS